MIFARRVYGRDFNKRAVESLIYSGALDGLGLNRRQMIYMLPSVVSGLDSDKSRNITGQIGFFDEGSQFAPSAQPKAPELEELPYDELLKNEKEYTGMYLSGHPMKEFEPVARAVRADRIADILEAGDSFSRYKDNSEVKLLGLVSKIDRKSNKNNQTMCFVQLEDMTGTAECIVFSKLFSQCAQYLQTGNVILVHGRLSLREDREPSVIVGSIEPCPKKAAVTAKKQETKKQRRGIFVRVKSKTDPRLRKLDLLCEIFSDGAFPLYLFDEESGKYECYAQVMPNGPLEDELRYIFGSENVAVRE